MKLHEFISGDMLVAKVSQKFHRMFLVHINRLSNIEPCRVSE